MDQGLATIIAGLVFPGDNDESWHRPPYPQGNAVGLAKALPLPSRVGP